MLPKSRLIFIQNIIFVQKFLCLVVDYSFNYLGKQREKGSRSVIFDFVLVSFLYRGFSFAILQSSGNKDNEIERLTRSVMSEAKTGAPSFRNLPVRLSIPALFAGFSCFKRLRMVAGATGAKEKFFPLRFSFL